MYLQSPLLTIGSGDVLSFWHSYDTESGYDGGVVEVSTNGTTWVDLGGNSTQNGYNGSISRSFGSPIAGPSRLYGKQWRLYRNENFAQRPTPDRVFTSGSARRATRVSPVSGGTWTT